MIEWVRNLRAEPYATLYESNITLNKPAAELLPEAQYIQMGITSDCGFIVIQPVSSEEKVVSTKDIGIFHLIVARSYSRVTNRAFMEMLRDRCHIALSYNAGTRYPVTLDKETNILYIDLNHPVKGGSLY